jgi:hypothetical protein
VDPQGAAEGREGRERIGVIALKEKWETVNTMRNGKRKIRIYELKEQKSEMGNALPEEYPSIDRGYRWTRVDT